MRRVASITEGLIKAKGDWDPEDSVFPLSPSSMMWDFDKAGCTLRRFLRKHYKGDTQDVMPHYVLRGVLMDRVVEAYLKDNLFNEYTAGEWLHKVEGLVLALYEEVRQGYEEVDKAFLDEVIGDILALLKKHGDELKADDVQPDLYLYIGKADLGDVPWDRIHEFARPQDLVYGKPDWLFNGPEGWEVHDLKATSRPVTGKSGVGRYRLPMLTYASAIYQTGEKVRGTFLQQWHTRHKRLEVASELFTEADYDLTIRRWRALRDHYVNVYSGTQDFFIPQRGLGECRPGRCNNWDGCPAGGLGIWV